MKKESNKFVYFVVAVAVVVVVGWWGTPPRGAEAMPNRFKIYSGRIDRWISAVCFGGGGGVQRSPIDQQFQSFGGSPDNFEKNPELGKIKSLRMARTILKNP